MGLAWGISPPVNCWIIMDPNVNLAVPPLDSEAMGRFSVE